MKKPQIEPEWMCDDQIINKSGEKHMCNLKEWAMSLLFYYIILVVGSMTSTQKCLINLLNE